MAQKTAHKRGDFVSIDGHGDNAVALVTEFAVMETEVTGEEGWPAQGQQQRDDLIVLNAFA